MFWKRYDQRQQNLLEAAEKRRRAIARQKSAELSKLDDREQREFTRQMEEARRIEQREEMQRDRSSRLNSSPKIKKKPEKRTSTSSRKQKSSSKNRKAKTVIKSKSAMHSSDRTRLFPEAQVNRVRNLLETTKELIPRIQHLSENIRLPEIDKVSFFDVGELRNCLEYQMQSLSRILNEETKVSKEIKAKQLKMEMSGLSILTKAHLQRKSESSDAIIKDYKLYLAFVKKILSKLQTVLNSPAGKKWQLYPAASLLLLRGIKKGESTSRYENRPRRQSVNNSLSDRYGPSRFLDFDGESLDDLANDWGWDSWDQFSDTIE
jgi:hypothetical protein